MHASVRLDHSLVAVDSEHDVHAMLELGAPSPPEDSARVPLSLALVLDRSGSMAGRKLEVAKACAAWLVSRLRADDELAVVDYDDAVRLVTPLLPVASGVHAPALADVHPGGSTNLSGGWLKALEQLRATRDGRARKILLLTDGLANVGITDPAALVAMVRNAARAQVGTTTIGFGADFDEDLLTAMADAGGGNGHHAPTPDAAPAIFAEEFEGLTRLVAQNVSVEIRPAEEVEVVGVLNEYPMVAVPGGVQVALGDAYGGERRRLVLALHVPHLAELGPARVADLVVRYVSVGEQIAEHAVTVPIVANVVSASEAAAAVPDAEVQEEVLVLRAARARDDAIRLADDGDHVAAQRLLAETATELRASGQAPLAEQADELDAAQDLVAPVSYLADGLARKRLRYTSRELRRKRG